MPLSAENNMMHQSDASEIMSLSKGGIIFVAPPTGDAETDRANIKSALAKAEPGNTIQFATGTYRIGSEILYDALIIDVPGITLRGSPNGTTLKGGENITVFGQYEGLALTGGKQVVRGLTFDSFSIAAININPHLFAETGGYVIEHNIFINSVVGVGFMGQSEDVSRIRFNVFDNIAQPFSVVGKTVYFERNKIMATQPEQVPIVRQPYNVGGAMALVGPSDNNIFANNIVEGFADGFWIVSDFGPPDAGCSNNLIKGNKFTDQVIFTEYDLGTMAWINSKEGMPFENNRVVDNTLEGSSGIGIIVIGGTNTIIARNSISGSMVYPDSYVQTGYGVYLDENSHGNKLLRNTLDNNELYDIVLFGNDNMVVLNSTDDKVLDNGEGNVVMGSRRVKTDVSQIALKVAEATEKKTELIRPYLDHILDRSEDLLQ